MRQLFVLRGELSKKLSSTIMLTGLAVILSFWYLITSLKLVPSAILPNPINVILSLKELVLNDDLFKNMYYSVKINMLGYAEALVLALPVGFVLGLFPVFREMFKKYIDAIRFLPLTALTGLFIAMFGLGDSMKIHFLAFGIIVFLLPAIMQRIAEVERVYCDTMTTLSASKWHMIKFVFIPATLSKLIEDIKLLISMGWTYVIVVELMNRSGGGLGSMAFTAARQHGRIDKVYAILGIIILIGIIQDKSIDLIGKTLFPHKKLG
jgi:NitT/TauT family transport system permease protein